VTLKMAYKLDGNRHFLTHKLDYVHWLQGNSLTYRFPSFLTCIISAVFI